MLAGERIVAENKLCIPVDPFELARSVGISVLEKPATGGVSGMFMRVGDEFAIAYAAHLANEGFQRFSVGHELGHYFLDGHIDHVLGVGDVHESRAGFISKAPHEVEADQFAVGLLLPSGQFGKLVDQSGAGLGAIEELAETCKTSLTATAIRFTVTRSPKAHLMPTSTMRRSTGEAYRHAKAVNPAAETARSRGGAGLGGSCRAGLAAMLRRARRGEAPRLPGADRVAG
jgi:Zn-dependent peptidase ImmA (M78 family)